MVGPPLLDKQYIVAQPTPLEYKYKQVFGVMPRDKTNTSATDASGSKSSTDSDKSHIDVSSTSEDGVKSKITVSENRPNSNQTGGTPTSVDEIPNPNPRKRSADSQNSDEEPSSKHTKVVDESVPVQTDQTNQQSELGSTDQDPKKEILTPKQETVDNRISEAQHVVWMCNIR